VKWGEIAGGGQDAPRAWGGSAWAQALRRKQMLRRAKQQVKAQTFPGPQAQPAAPLSSFVAAQVEPYQPGVMPWIAALRENNK
jgi:hypothetical protein